jgi:nitroimidazol reductase NimA-like FMN-containing flavoprotein (pyridoxamine 5'-phosphate oxidase superfamily)
VGASSIVAERDQEQPKDEVLADEAVDAAGDPAADADSVERRQFVRRIGTDAIGMAGTFMGLSRMLTRGVMAASEAVATELGGMTNEGETVVRGGMLDAAAGMDADGESAEGLEVDDEAPVGQPEAAVVAANPVLPSPVLPSPVLPSPVLPTLAIDADQAALLGAATSAVVAVNRSGHPPQLTTATVLWDGETLRFATLGWSRRATMLRADPAIAFLLDGADGRFLTMTGTARILEGREAHDAMLPLLLREAGGSEAAAEAKWAELVAADADRAVIVVAPDQVLSGQR